MFFDNVVKVVNFALPEQFKNFAKLKKNDESYDHQKRYVCQESRSLNA